MSTNFVRDYQAASKPQTSEEQTQQNQTWNSRILKPRRQIKTAHFLVGRSGMELIRRASRDLYCRMWDRLYYRLYWVPLPISCFWSVLSL